LSIIVNMKNSVLYNLPILSALVYNFLKEKQCVQDG
jgi:hypothetical protein